MLLIVFPAPFSDFGIHLFSHLTLISSVFLCLFRRLVPDGFLVDFVQALIAFVNLVGKFLIDGTGGGSVLCVSVAFKALMRATQLGILIAEIDKGFDSVFNKIGSTIKANPQEYRQQILELQNLIRTITDIGVEIEGLENKNKEKFSKFILAKREEIKDFKKSNNTAASYYKNMSNQHQEWKSYFVDRKN